MTEPGWVSPHPTLRPLAGTSLGLEPGPRWAGPPLLWLGVGCRFGGSQLRDSGAAAGKDSAPGLWAAGLCGGHGVLLASASLGFCALHPTKHLLGSLSAQACPLPGALAALRLPACWSRRHAGAAFWSGCCVRGLVWAKR